MNSRKSIFIAIRENKNAIFLTSIYTSALLLLLGHLFYDLYTGGDEWKQGDWLINNAGGLVRRGLMGSFLIKVSSSLNISVLQLLIALQALITSLIFAFFWYFGLKYRNSDIVFFLLISPLFLIFWSNNADASMRKEILSYLAFIPLLFCLLENSHLTKKFVIMSICVYLIAVYSHEGNIFFAPFYILIIYIDRKKVDYYVFISSITYFVISTSGLVYALSFSTVSDTTEICQAILHSGVNEKICNGAIAWLERDSRYAVGSTYDMMLSGASLLLLHSITFIFLYIIFLLSNIFGVIRTTWLLLFSIFAFSPLYVIGIDWGRWLNFSIFSFTAIFLTWVTKRKRPEIFRKFDSYAWLVCFVFCVTWGVHHVGGAPDFMYGFIYQNVKFVHSSFDFLLNP
ncbi:MAG: hypothetical protein ACLFOY_08360 [Desulfatibacillaceae bacterium]